MSENEERRSKKKPIFRTSPLQINGQDASRLVGGIVEKGFSSHAAPPPPRPTVLPFPAARHRSHGPHWNPAGGCIGDDDWDMDDVEEEGFSGYENAAAFAQPMQRKEKKSVDFTKWRELMASDQSGDLLVSKKAKKKNAGSIEKTQVVPRLNENDDVLRRIEDVQPQCAFPVCDRADEMDTDVFESVKDPEEVSAMVLDGEPSQSNGMYNLGTGFGSNQLFNKNVGSTSLESEIDAENRARLERMSSNEIAEAHAEIKARMSPALIEKLRKRGQDKLQRKKGPASDTAASSPQVVGSSIMTNPSGSPLKNSSPKGVPASQSNVSLKVMTADSKDAQQGLGNAGQVKLSSKSSSLWESWSRRVESVREIRFSVDGDVMKSDISYGEGNFGNASARSGYNVSERDFLRTEGDPGATGYTIKEALALTRSVVPGQRVFALQLISSILDRAIFGLYEKKVGCTFEFPATDGNIDWEAIWAFALGPEPELALSLRICLDDNHNSVVLACAKAIRSVLSCDLNESFFDASEKLPCIHGDVHTAAVFRTKSDMDVGFLPGGFWKYSAKQSNLVPFADEVDHEVPEQGEHTIQDDIVVAGQDVAAGLIRMGVLERVSYLLETQPSAALEECLLSILIAIARHSPSAATAIRKCNGLVQAIVDRFISKEQMKITPSKIKSVIFLKVGQLEQA
ncbi:OLC1v1003567C1 [Oldenlandia corymbosa var. corymbosa]|uniref:OLC1v1003567C1 n=1 Tax=Oldenlandia corymbosa var. corymbosa TaxID=529605 RepID=A0AAV1DAB7_OLDCO|nr:OLC1v1003567C1 [Oldenlandia corymbosa var. corymbosa]